MHSQYLQHMQTGPLGGQEALRENDSQRKRHNEQIFKTMTEEELALEVRYVCCTWWRCMEC